MITPRRHLFTALILSLAACSTQDLDGDGFFRQLQPGDHPITMVGSLGTPQGRLRIKVDGQFLVTGVVDSKFIYVELVAGRSYATVPAGSRIDLVNEAGQTLLDIDPVTPLPTTQTLIWVHDAQTGLVAEIQDFVPDEDETTAEVSAVNVSDAERVIVSRCAGVVRCTTCATVTGSSNSLPGTFEPSACEAITIIGPGEEWAAKLEPTNIAAGGSGSACLAVQDEGSMVGPMCLVELNRPSVNFQGRSRIFIDGLATTGGYLSDGTAISYPGAFAAGNRF